MEFDLLTEEEYRKAVEDGVPGDELEAQRLKTLREVVAWMKIMPEGVISFSLLSIWLTNEAKAEGINLE